MQIQCVSASFDKHRTYTTPPPQKKPKKKKQRQRYFENCSVHVFSLLVISELSSEIFEDSGSSKKETWLFTNMTKQCVKAVNCNVSILEMMETSHKKKVNAQNLEWRNLNSLNACHLAWKRNFCVRKYFAIDRRKTCHLNIWSWRSLCSIFLKIGTKQEKKSQVFSASLNMNRKTCLFALVRQFDTGIVEKFISHFQSWNNIWNQFFSTMNCSNYISTTRRPVPVSSIKHRVPTHQANQNSLISKQFSLIFCMQN